MKVTLRHRVGWFLIQLGVRVLGYTMSELELTDAVTGESLFVVRDKA